MASCYNGKDFPSYVIFSVKYYAWNSIQMYMHTVLYAWTLENHKFDVKEMEGCDKNEGWNTSEMGAVNVYLSPKNACSYLTLKCNVGYQQ